MVGGDERRCLRPACDPAPARWRFRAPSASGSRRRAASGASDTLSVTSTCTPGAAHCARPGGRGPAADVAEASTGRGGSRPRAVRARRRIAARADDDSCARVPQEEDLSCFLAAKERRPSATQRTSPTVNDQGNIASRAHPARGRRELPRRPPIPATPGSKGPLTPGIPAYPRSARKCHDRPVTPEVAGSSPVAPVS